MSTQACFRERKYTIFVDNCLFDVDFKTENQNGTFSLHSIVIPKEGKKSTCKFMKNYLIRMVKKPLNYGNVRINSPNFITDEDIKSWNFFLSRKIIKFLKRNHKVA